MLDSYIADEEYGKLSKQICYNPMVSKIELLLSASSGEALLLSLIVAHTSRPKPLSALVPQWFNKGIIFVSDLIDKQRELITHHELIKNIQDPILLLGISQGKT